MSKARRHDVAWAVRLVPGMVTVWLYAASSAGGYDYFRNIRYPGERRTDVGLDRVEQEGGHDAIGYARRVVDWWPKKGVDIVDVPDSVPERLWTIRTGELEPLVQTAYYAKWWPADLKGRKQFKAHLIGFRGIGSREGDPFADRALLLAQGKGICPSVVLRLEDGRKRCFARGSFSDADQAWILDLYDREMARVRRSLEPPPEKIPPHIESEWPIGELHKPGTYREESERFVVSSGSEELPDGVPGAWINPRREADSAAYRRNTFRIFEDYWAYNEYAGHLMPYWEKAERYKYSVVFGSTRVNGHQDYGRGNGGGYGGCGTACWEGLYHEWGHGFGSDPMVLLGGGETRCDALQTMADPALVRKVSFQISRPYKNLFWGQYPGGFGYTMLGDDPNWGYAAVASFPCLASEVENTPMHVMARLGKARGIWENGIKGVGDFMGQIGARMAEYDYELEGMLRGAYPAPNRTCLVALDRSRGLYRSPVTEAPEPFGINVVRLIADPDARRLTIDFTGLYDPDTHGDWRACIVAVGKNGRPRYSPLWNRGRMTLKTLGGDKRYWLTVTATPAALAPGRQDGGNKINHIYQGGFTYKYPYEVGFSGCRPAGPHTAIGINQNMDLLGPALIARTDANLDNCGRGDWPHPSDTPEYEEMKRTLEALVVKAPRMVELYLREHMFNESSYCPVVGRKDSLARAVASAVFLEWRANWLLENAQGARHPNGGGWVAASAGVAPTAYVGLDCMVLDGAQVLDYAIVEDGAMISGPKVLIKDYARVYGKAVVCGDVTLTDYARVCRTIWNRLSKFEWDKSDPAKPPYRFEMTTAAPVRRDGPEERVEVFRGDGYKLQANYAFDRPETVLLEDWYQEHSLGAFAFGAHSTDLVYYDGVLYGRPGFERDGDTRAFTFNGQNQYAEADGAVADLGVITVDVSLKPALGTEQTVFDFGSSCDHRFRLTLTPAGEPVLVIVRDGREERVAGAKTLPDGQWSTCRVEMDGQRIRLWVNNRKTAETESSYRAAHAFPAGLERRNFFAASREWKDLFRGALDYVRIYSAVFEDFAAVPDPPMVSSRRIARDFVERFDRTFAGYRDIELRTEEQIRTNDVYRFYERWKKRVTDRIGELETSDKVLALEQEIRQLRQAHESLKNERRSEFDRMPANAQKKRQWEEIERARVRRFHERLKEMAEYGTVREDEERWRRTREEIEGMARRELEKTIGDLHKQERGMILERSGRDPRHAEAYANERKARERKSRLERDVWDSPELKAMERARNRHDTGREREAFARGVDMDFIPRIGLLQGRVKALREQTALARSADEYRALSSLTGLNDQYSRAIVKAIKKEVLPLMPENEAQLKEALVFQQGAWHEQVDWASRTRWEQSGEELPPIMQRWLRRMKPYEYE